MQKKEPLSVVSNGLLKILQLLVELLIPVQHLALRIRQLFQHMFGRIQSLIENRLLTTKVPMTVWSRPDRSCAVYGTLPLFLAMVLCAGFPSA